MFQELILVLLHHHQQTLRNLVKPQLAQNIIAFLLNSFALFHFLLGLVLGVFF